MCGHPTSGHDFGQPRRSFARRFLLREQTEAETQRPSIFEQEITEETESVLYNLFNFSVTSVSSYSSSSPFSQN
jgi:hypothetical protein